MRRRVWDIRANRIYIISIIIKKSNGKRLLEYLLYLVCILASTLILAIRYESSMHTMHSTSVVEYGYYSLVLCIL